MQRILGRCLFAFTLGAFMLGAFPLGHANTASASPSMPAVEVLQIDHLYRTAFSANLPHRWATQERVELRRGGRRIGEIKTFLGPDKQVLATVRTVYGKGPNETDTVTRFASGTVMTETMRYGHGSVHTATIRTTDGKVFKRRYTLRPDSAGVLEAWTVK